MQGRARQGMARQGKAREDGAGLVERILFLGLESAAHTAIPPRLRGILRFEGSQRGLPGDRTYVLEGPRVR